MTPGIFGVNTLEFLAFTLIMILERVGIDFSIKLHFSEMYGLTKYLILLRITINTTEIFGFLKKKKNLSNGVILLILKEPMFWIIQ